MAEEVLDRQPEHLRTFLLETSVLARLSGPLCDAVTGRSDSQDLLEEVERANLFLVPLDEVRRWWRYHHLFADLLRARLERERPERLQALHGNAATWCEGHGLVDDAIGHAVAADDPQRAARLVERNAEELMQRGEGATVHGWLRALPVELVRARPQLSLAKAMAALVEGRSDPDEIEPLLEDAEQAPGTSEPYQPSVGRVGSLLANVPAGTALVRAHLAYLRRDAEATAAFAQQAQAQLTEVDRTPRAFADWYLAMATRFGLSFYLWTHRDPHRRTHTCGCVRSVSPAIRASQPVTVAATGQADSAGIMRRACSRRTAYASGGRSPR
jgi:LuxR family maltose regulon positive regulatory protein